METDSKSLKRVLEDTPAVAGEEACASRRDVGPDQSSSSARRAVSPRLALVNSQDGEPGREDQAVSSAAVPAAGTLVAHQPVRIGTVESSVGSWSLVMGGTPRVGPDGGSQGDAPSTLATAAPDGLVAPGLPSLGVPPGLGGTAEGPSRWKGEFPSN